MNETGEKTQRSRRTVSQSQVEQVHIVLPPDVNADFSLFGGQLMQWIDIVAAVVARRHSGFQVTTAAVDHLEFLAPAKLNDIVILRGRITYAGSTSMEVCVETFVEDGKNKEIVHLVNSAYLTMVALDQERRPTVVPLLIPETEREKTDFEAARKRREQRKRTKV